ncbi:MAG TPA: hypothetical protein VNW28_01165, partial [Chthoniobacterales bacterium]|nr:hypothetical protein [Chthoniobacterales bacterium]
KALLLAGERTQIVQVNLAAEDIYSELRQIAQDINNSLRATTVDAEFTRLPDAPNPAFGSAQGFALGMDSASHKPPQ